MSAVVLALGGLLAFSGQSLGQPAQAQVAPPMSVSQGPAWTDAERRDWYSIDQGSRIMPLAWMRALRLADGTPFMADGLGRYGFLSSPLMASGLPIGFSLAGPGGRETVGLTCAGCHTRRIEAGGRAYLIDGGPAMIDFQAFLADLNAAVGRVVREDAAFQRFAAEVLGSGVGTLETETLRRAVEYWFARNDTLIANALPPLGNWGPGRLDAVSMIFNRLTGLDIGPRPSYLIKENIRPADAPVRYPFLWNAHKEQITQWAGFAPNFQDFMRTIRNIGQVIGVFGQFHPEPSPALGGDIDFVAQSSIQIAGLQRLEGLMERIGPPRWPWPVDAALAERGAAIYDRECASCHQRESDPNAWKTRTYPVGTDVRQLGLLGATVNTGSLKGASVAFLGPLGEQARAIDVLLLSSLGVLLAVESPPSLPALKQWLDIVQAPENRNPPPAYVARSLHGIWAAAPYLHNGSVATLAELLKPATDRRASFAVGPAYDPVEVGLARVQPGPFVLHTTGCENIFSGNSRCGHEFGTLLPEGDKRALLEYLKSL